MKRDHDQKTSRKRLYNPVKTSSVLDRELEKLGIKTSIKRYQIVQNWPKIVTPSIAAHSKAEKIIGSTLFVLVDSSVWMNELSANSGVLLQKINRSLPLGATRIEEIKFRQCSWAKEKINQVTDTKQQELTEADKRKHRLILENIKDPELKKLLAEILRKDTLLKKSRLDDSP